MREVPTSLSCLIGRAEDQVTRLFVRRSDPELPIYVKCRLEGNYGSELAGRHLTFAVSGLFRQCPTLFEGYLPRPLRTSRLKSAKKCQKFACLTQKMPITLIGLRPQTFDRDPQLFHCEIIPTSYHCMNARVILFSFTLMNLFFCPT